VGPGPSVILALSSGLAAEHPANGETQ